MIVLGNIPCKDVSPEGDVIDGIGISNVRWSRFKSFLDLWEQANEGAPLGYTYAGQFRFDLETLSSTYPDFHPFCGELPFCGNTCCVPADEWDDARAAAAGE